MLLSKLDMSCVEQDVYAWMISAVEEKKLAVIEAARHDIVMTTGVVESYWLTGL